MTPNSFNIRAYGILINDRQEVLLTDEYRFGMEMTKFPGGGLRFGEGLADCVRREFREELDKEVQVVRHLYTTDFFQPSAFDESQQLISVYFRVSAASYNDIPVTPKEEAFSGPEEGYQSFRWVALDELPEEELTFPVDRKVAGMLKG